ncbi:hypothetical protein NE237_020132 [Protea cynaroides]|uniref:Uncharacterized protein n=1 Tax=Protea cynaroides TaxID=273540 RepID=A0A9Q0H9Z3_9MAGN|nr:hypothetical protein NE237_020132 [Protea cynaroides]
MLATTHFLPETTKWKGFPKIPMRLGTMKSTKRTAPNLSMLLGSSSTPWLKSSSYKLSSSRLLELKDRDLCIGTLIRCTATNHPTKFKKNSCPQCINFHHAMDRDYSNSTTSVCMIGLDPAHSLFLQKIFHQSNMIELLLLVSIPSLKIFDD